jgi:hypothetical protein
MKTSVASSWQFISTYKERIFKIPTAVNAFFLLPHTKSNHRQGTVLLNVKNLKIRKDKSADKLCAYAGVIEKQPNLRMLSESSHSSLRNILQDVPHRTRLVCAFVQPNKHVPRSQDSEEFSD